VQLVFIFSAITQQIVII